MERKFKRKITALSEIFDFIDTFLDENEISEPLAFTTKLAAEELFTNLVRHNTGGSDHILISLDKESSRIVLRLKDFNVEPFNPSDKEKVDIHLPLSERQVGGLGIHLVKSIVDKLTYEYEDRTLCVTAIKNTEDRDV